MKIAVVSRYFPSSAEPWQGRSAYQTLRVLGREAEVQVFFPNAVYPALLKPRSRIYNRLDTAFAVPDVKVNYLNYSALPLLSRPWSGSRVARLLLPQIRAFAPDVIFGVFLYPDGYAAMQIGKALGVPVVAMSIGSDLNRIGDAISARHTRRALREVDFVVTVSEHLRQTALAMGARAERTRTLHNGCDLSVFRTADRTEARRALQIDAAAEAVVYVGRMDVKKGLRELVEAASALKPQRPRLQVYMVGAGPDRELLEAAVAARHAEAYIHLLPACGFDEVPTWMTAADVVTLPSYMEGLPNVVVEALACGRPVVATRVGGIPEILSDVYGRLVEPRSAGDLRRGLAEALDATWDANAISAGNSRSWDAVAAELKEVLEQVVAQPQLL